MGALNVPHLQTVFYFFYKKIIPPHYCLNAFYRKGLIFMCIFVSFDVLSSHTIDIKCLLHKNKTLIDGQNLNSTWH